MTAKSKSELHVQISVLEWQTTDKIFSAALSLLALEDIEGLEGAVVVSAVDEELNPVTALMF
jgi:hypothetical protein